ncbi:unnamed protein product [Acanthoscelides obtectus]|uniref:Nuclease HARBI1 n=1 Tax=Acanthoscelides obtectus TaxID=200917 RepID=A0A9P0Q314_ACAOB|nr:unnamed protein product [Acanthoscelides obtectus]CAK1637914.1 hypothetical protein AOBTE_LOCUS10287 [Acanthoscelides obtectus]
MPQLRLDEQRFYVYFRMTPGCFDEILNLVKDEIRKSDTNYREAISPEERLAITLRFLATGDTFYTIGHSVRVGFTTVSAIVTEVCEAICRHMEHIYLPEPTENIWKNVLKNLKIDGDFPIALAAWTVNM